MRISQQLSQPCPIPEATTAAGPGPFIPLLHSLVGFKAENEFIWRFLEFIWPVEEHRDDAKTSLLLHVPVQWPEVTQSFSHQAEEAQEL